MCLLDGMKADFGVWSDAHSINTVLSGYATQRNVARCREIMDGMKVHAGHLHCEHIPESARAVEGR